MDFAEAKARIKDCMMRDRFRLRKLEEKIRNGDGLEDQLIDRVAKSLTQRDDRAAIHPLLEFPEELPISQRREEIGKLIAAHPVVVVCGETGSGKSTQLPKICLEQGLGICGMIGHTQPRRIAARSIANRLASEMKTSVGQSVGFKVRFTDQTSPKTLVKLMTDGILLAETQQDRFLEQYDAIILDEAHERSLNIDFLIGILHRLVARRPDFKVVVTSATIDAQRFQRHFETVVGEVPVIEVAGRTYPVEVRYRPVEQTDAGEDADEIDGIVESLREAFDEGLGDALVFLPTERAIRDAAKRLRTEQKNDIRLAKVDILPLYARLSAGEQNKIFQPGARHRIVLATNVAESSVTVPRIRYVVDVGTARISRYSSRSRVQRLPIEAVSRASADQRKGRCGRLGPGICFRVFAEPDFLSRDEYTTPEIRRTNLASVILQTETLRLGRISEFPFMEPPRPEAIRDGFRTLFEIGAIDDRRRLTPLGHRLGRLPVDPRIGRMILASADNGSLADVLIIAAALEIQDPRDRPAEKQKAADEAHEQFKDERSDFMSLLRLWDFFERQRQKLSRSRFRKACQQNFVNYNRLQEWHDIYRQLRQLVESADMKIGLRRNEEDLIHQSLLTGMLSSLGFRDSEYEYTGTGGNKFHLWPGSGLFKSRPKWVMASELVETSRRYMRTVATINPDWIEPIAEHLVKKSHFDAFWSSKQETPFVYERVTLFGLPIVTRRRVPLGPHDPKLARQLLIQHGLVEGEMEPVSAFSHANEAVIDEVKQLGAKRRDASFVLDEFTLIEFYDKRLPEHVFDRRTLIEWLKSDPLADKTLTMQVDDLVTVDEPEDVTADDPFPNRVVLDGIEVPVVYSFEPGEASDGATIQLPPQAVGHLSPRALGWLVPGLLEEKVIGLIRSLPKRIRRNLVPAPDTAKLVVERLDYGVGDFLDQVTRHLSDIAEEPIPLSEFRLEKLSPHLHFNIEVVDESGDRMAIGRDLSDVRAELGMTDKGPSNLVIDDDQWNQSEVTDWTIDQLPESVQVRRGSMTIPAHPSFVARDDGSIAIQLLSSSLAARSETLRAMRRFLVRREERELRKQVKYLPNLDKCRLLGQGLFENSSLEAELIELIAARSIPANAKPPRDRTQFETLLREAARSTTAAAHDVGVLVPQLFEKLHVVRLSLTDLKKSPWQHAVADVTTQWQELVEDGFLSRTEWDWLQQYPRYLEAIEIRIQKLKSGQKAKDEEHTRILRGFWTQYTETREMHRNSGLRDPELDLFRWMIEEFRVSLFAQTLGTICRVSEKRLEKQWEKVEKV